MFLSFFPYFPFFRLKSTVKFLLLQKIVIQAISYLSQLICDQSYFVLNSRNFFSYATHSPWFQTLWQQKRFFRILKPVPEFWLLIGSRTCCHPAHTLSSQDLQTMMMTNQSIRLYCSKMEWLQEIESFYPFSVQGNELNRSEPVYETVDRTYTYRETKKKYRKNYSFLLSVRFNVPVRIFSSSLSGLISFRSP